MEARQEAEALEDMAGAFRAWILTGTGAFVIYIDEPLGLTRREQLLLLCGRK